MIEVKLTDPPWVNELRQRNAQRDIALSIGGIQHLDAITWRADELKDLRKLCEYRLCALTNFWIPENVIIFPNVRYS